MDDSRRRTLRALAGLAGGLALAGCTEQSTRDDGTDDDVDDADDESGLDEPPSTTATETAAGPFADWLADVPNYDGTVRDWRGRSTVRVRVGVDAGAEPFGFGPPAVHVDPGTTIRWEWTGEGGGHNVVATDGTFDSGEVVTVAGVTFEFTAEQAGAYEYYCVPHRSVGMRGGLLVGDPPDVAAPTYDQSAGTPAESTRPSPTEVPPATPDYDGYLDDARNFDGTVVDATGQSSVTVAVGAEGNGGTFAFDPPAVRVDAGTTVRWEWTGEGGAHSVVAADGRFVSDLTDQANVTYEHTFQTVGVARYYCAPHRTLGMKGVVEVVDG